MKKNTRNTITRRWMVNSLGVIAVVLVLLVSAFGVFINYYYLNYSRQYLTGKLNTVSSILQQYYTDDPQTFAAQVRSVISGWSDKSSTELMSVSSDGRITMTSSGFTPTREVLASDFTDAISTGTSGYFRGRLPDGERVMAMSVVTPASTGDQSVIRIMTSLDRVNRRVAIYIIAAAAIAVAILLLMFFSGMYFVKSIVIPVNQLGATARKYSRGDFSTRIPVKNDDEIGELCVIINHMADDLSKSEAMKNEFISSVSHELRTPLTAIKGWAETIGSMPDDKETVTKGMRVINSETQRLSEMVEDLLDFSRMSNGRFTLNLGNVDVLAELGDAVLIYREKAKADDIELIYSEPEDLPIVFGDRNRLRQVFINVIDNAIKYSDPGGRVTVEAAESEEGNITITVADTGMGIAPEDLPRIKEKFFRANHIKRGSGIGLAVADEIMMLHGGSLNVSSVQGEGTTVTISLPPKKMAVTPQIG
ncbi:MAG: HAMP domain-containing histidine kinase [Oscillospiraceae bacterium]|nr:HAMP domain-containing histidine kinase [Oscillospiraceae bacterium]